MHGDGLLLLGSNQFNIFDHLTGNPADIDILKRCCADCLLGTGNEQHVGNHALQAGQFFKSLMQRFAVFVNRAFFGEHHLSLGEQGIDGRAQLMSNIGTEMPK